VGGESTFRVRRKTMSTPTETSDSQLLELLRVRGPLSVSEMAEASEVTATAVRQRLTRLMGQGFVARSATRNGRGRPSHRYVLTDKARRLAGNNFADLAMVLWNELRGIADPEVRRGLLQRLAAAMAQMYSGQVRGSTPAERMQSLGEVFGERRVPVAVANSEVGPQLTVIDCPYPELAESDRGICAMEKMLFAELVDAPLRLAECRLDGHSCCRFETN